MNVVCTLVFAAFAQIVIARHSSLRGAAGAVNGASTEAGECVHRVINAVANPSKCPITVTLQYDTPKTYVLQFAESPQPVETVPCPEDGNVKYHVVFADGTEIDDVATGLDSTEAHFTVIFESTQNTWHTVIEPVLLPFINPCPYTVNVRYYDGYDDQYFDISPTDVRIHWLIKRDIKVQRIAHSVAVVDDVFVFNATTSAAGSEQVQGLQCINNPVPPHQPARCIVKMVNAVPDATSVATFTLGDDAQGVPFSSVPWPPEPIICNEDGEVDVKFTAKFGGKSFHSTVKASPFLAVFIVFYKGETWSGPDISYDVETMTVETSAAHVVPFVIPCDYSHNGNRPILIPLTYIVNGKFNQTGLSRILLLELPGTDDIVVNVQGKDLSVLPNDAVFVYSTTAATVASGNPGITPCTYNPSPCVHGVINAVTNSSKSPITVTLQYTTRPSYVLPYGRSPEPVTTIPCPEDGNVRYRVEFADGTEFEDVATGVDTGGLHFTVIFDDTHNTWHGLREPFVVPFVNPCPYPVSVTYYDGSANQTIDMNPTDVNVIWMSSDHISVQGVDHIVSPIDDAFVFNTTSIAGSEEREGLQCFTPPSPPKATCIVKMIHAVPDEALEVTFSLGGDSYDGIEFGTVPWPREPITCPDNGVVKFSAGFSNSMSDMSGSVTATPTSAVFIIFFKNGDEIIYNVSTLAVDSSAAYVVPFVNPCGYGLPVTYIVNGSSKFSQTYVAAQSVFLVELLGTGNVLVNVQGRDLLVSYNNDDVFLYNTTVADIGSGHTSFTPCIYTPRQCFHRVINAVTNTSKTPITVTLQYSSQPSYVLEFGQTPEPNGSIPCPEDGHVRYQVVYADGSEINAVAFGVFEGTIHFTVIFNDTYKTLFDESRYFVVPFVNPCPYDVYVDAYDGRSFGIQMGPADVSLEDLHHQNITVQGVSHTLTLNDDLFVFNGTTAAAGSERVPGLQCVKKLPPPPPTCIVKMVHAISEGGLRARFSLQDQEGTIANQDGITYGSAPWPASPVPFPDDGEIDFAAEFSSPTLQGSIGGSVKVSSTSAVYIFLFEQNRQIVYNVSYIPVASSAAHVVPFVNPCEYDIPVEYSIYENAQSNYTYMEAKSGIVVELPENAHIVEVQGRRLYVQDNDDVFVFSQVMAIAGSSGANEVTCNTFPIRNCMFHVVNAAVNETLPIKVTVQYASQIYQMYFTEKPVPSQTVPCPPDGKIRYNVVFGDKTEINDFAPGVVNPEKVYYLVIFSQTNYKVFEGDVGSTFVSVPVINPCPYSIQVSYVSYGRVTVFDLKPAYAQVVHIASRNVTIQGVVHELATLDDIFVFNTTTALIGSEVLPPPQCINNPPPIIQHCDCDYWLLIDSSRDSSTEHNVQFTEKLLREMRGSNLITLVLYSQSLEEFPATRSKDEVLDIVRGYNRSTGTSPRTSALAALRAATAESEGNCTRVILFSTTGLFDCGDCTHGYSLHIHPGTRVLVLAFPNPNWNYIKANRVRVQTSRDIDYLDSGTSVFTDECQPACTGQCNNTIVDPCIKSIYCGRGHCFSESVADGTSCGDEGECEGGICTRRILPSPQLYRPPHMSSHWGTTCCIVISLAAQGPQLTEMSLVALTATKGTQLDEYHFIVDNGNVSVWIDFPAMQLASGETIFITSNITEFKSLFPSSSGLVNLQLPYLDGLVEKLILVRSAERRYYQIDSQEQPSLGEVWSLNPSEGWVDNSQLPIAQLPNFDLVHVNATCKCIPLEADVDDNGVYKCFSLGVTSASATLSTSDLSVSFGSEFTYTAPGSVIGLNKWNCTVA